MSPQVKIINHTHPLGAPLQAGYCDSFLCRLRGLMFRTSLPPRWGLLLVERSDSRINTAIHMAFMGFDIAAVWINTAGEVVDVQIARRWRPFYMPARPARYTLEMAVAHAQDFQIGDRISFEAVD